MRVNFRMHVRGFQRSFSSALSLLAPVKLPSRMETHFWYILPDEVHDTTLLDQYVELLSPCERENIFSMREDHLRKRALLARALVRTTIARYQINCQVNPRMLKFKKNIYGKPEVEWPIFDDWDPPPLNFNISHTSSLIACGVTVNSPIGVDVEEKQRRLKSDIMSFARRYFSPPEVETLMMISDPEVRRQEFIKLWTLKEAYVKALGRGFSAVPFKTFTIQFRAGTKEDGHVLEKLDNKTSEILVESSNDPTVHTRNFQFSLLELAGSHYAAICVENDKAIDGEGCAPLKLNVWKTIPFVKDEYVSGTKAVVPIGGLIQQF